MNTSPRISTKVRNVFGGAGKIGRNGADGSHIKRDVFAGHAVAARQPLFEYAVAVDEVQREPVDLDLAQLIGSGLPSGQSSPRSTPSYQSCSSSMEKTSSRLIMRDGVAHGGEVVGEGAADAMRWATADCRAWGTRPRAVADSVGAHHRRRRS